MVADDAQIFQLCQSGSLQVCAPLSEGKASVWDRDSDGLTTLHMSVIPAPVSLNKNLLMSTFVSQHEAGDLTSIRSSWTEEREN